MRFSKILTFSVLFLHAFPKVAPTRVASVKALETSRSG